MKSKDSGFSCGYSIFAKAISDFVKYSISYPPTAGVVGYEVKKADKNATGSEFQVINPYKEA
ncbi:hypothetical protein [Desulfosediminicola flagellatus]|uniref:hypothetical protein n=1 Tax=Desulfosediminicola flagellatus TaxID=2569541 RepID=UPI0010AB893A|nr:hypothetical protein [Desulfosediminicola flagellatus]